MSKHWQIIVFLSLFLIEEIKIEAFNLSPVPSAIFKPPKLKTHNPQNGSSLFGYAIVLRESSIIVGAPRAESSLPMQKRIQAPGAIYKCPLNLTSLSNITTEANACLPFPIDSDGNLYAARITDYELKDHQLLGAAMDGGPKDTDPFLACAPHFVGGFDVLKEYTFLHGICHWTENTKTDSTKIKSFKIKSLPERKPQYGYKYQMGEQGFSAHITPNNKEFLMGAPGLDVWQGSLVRYEYKTKRTSIPHFPGSLHSYHGYAVTSGYLNSHDPHEIDYVMTAPRASAPDFMSQAKVFGIASKDDKIEVYTVLRSGIYGDYFGYAALVQDVNNDNLDDIIISAPLHSLDGEIDVGAIYVFLNGGEFSFESKYIAAPFSTKARFGTAISKLGDINRDGYNDIAVSAPFLDDRGVVTIYLGGSDGLQLKPSQILRSPSTTPANMFGHSISKGVDIDGNGFNDLAIGELGSESVYIYRSYPVVHILVSIHSLKPKIALNETVLELKYCYRMDTASKDLKSVELELNIEADKKIHRILFDEKTVSHLNVEARAIDQCKDIKAAVKYIPHYIFTPIDIELSYKLKYDARQYDKQDFCTKCVILEPSSRKSARESVTYKHGCAKAVCNVDLKVSALKMPTNFTLGLSDFLHATYLIESLGEQAFDTQIEITTSLNVSFAKMPTNCIEDDWDRTKLICALNSRHGFSNQTTLDVAFDMGGLLNVTEMNVTITASSSGNETNPLDNTLNSTIIFYMFSTIEILGKSNETFVSIVNKPKSMKIFYSFELHNNGPSMVNNIELVISMPSIYINKRNQSINFFHPNTSHVVLITTGHTKLEPITFQSLEESFTRNSTLTSIIHEHVRMEQELLPENGTITLYCNNTSNVTCITNQQFLPTFKVGRTVTIQLVININTKAVRKILKKSLDYLALFIDASIKSSSLCHTNLNITKILKPVILVNIGPPRTPLWIYIVSVGGGLLLLISIALALRKYGFFKRQTKEEMEELIHEKIEKARMKAELESEPMLENMSTDDYCEIQCDNYCNDY